MNITLMVPDKGGPGKITLAESGRLISVDVQVERVGNVQIIHVTDPDPAKRPEESKPKRAPYMYSTSPADMVAFNRSALKDFCRIANSNVQAARELKISHTHLCRMLQGTVTHCDRALARKFNGCPE